jgi:hypothetical protein
MAKSRSESATLGSLNLIDEELLLAVLKFASEDLKTPQDATEVFAKVVRRWISERVLDRDDRKVFMLEWVKARIWVREVLPRLAKYDRLPVEECAALRTEFNSVLLDCDPPRTLQIGGRGVLFRRTRDPDCVRAACARALLPFMIPVGGWDPSRLAQCQHRHCGIWFLRPPRRRGSLSWYCSPGHGNSERVMRHRDNQRGVEK